MTLIFRQNQVNFSMMLCSWYLYRLESANRSEAMATCFMSISPVSWMQIEAIWGWVALRTESISNPCPRFLEKCRTTIWNHKGWRAVPTANLVLPLELCSLRVPTNSRYVFKLGNCVKRAKPECIKGFQTAVPGAQQPEDARSGTTGMTGVATCPGQACAPVKRGK